MGDVCRRYLSGVGGTRAGVQRLLQGILVGDLQRDEAEGRQDSGAVHHIDARHRRESVLGEDDLGLFRDQDRDDLRPFLQNEQTHSPALSSASRTLSRHQGWRCATTIMGRRKGG